MPLGLPVAIAGMLRSRPRPAKWSEVVEGDDGANKADLRREAIRERSNTRSSFGGIAGGGTANLG